MTQAVTHAATETEWVDVQAMSMTSVEAGSESRSKLVSMGSKLGRPTLKQHTFDCSATDKYTEVINFRLEVNNTFQT